MSLEMPSGPRQIETAPPLPARNPFAACRWTSERVPLWLPPGETLPGLVDRLARQRFCGQIVGPHGSGKSTLLRHLRLYLQRRLGARCMVEGRTGRPGAAWWKLLLPPSRRAGPRQLWLIDGWERLPGRRKLWLRLGRRLGHGMIATAHAPLGLPTLMHTQATDELLRHLLLHLGAETQRLLAPGETLSGLLARHGGNLREVLFELYDRYERASSGC